MKHQWLAYVIVALLSIGAGVAIAGLPDNVPVDATIIPPTTTEAPETTLPETTIQTTTVPSTTEPETTEPETTEPETTEPETTEPETVPDRSEIIVGVANGAGIAGAAARNVVRLTEAGYVEVTPLDGSDVVDLTVVYYADGFEAAAVRMAEDLDLLPEFVQPLEDAPEVVDLDPDVELLAYIGIDRAN